MMTEHEHKAAEFYARLASVEDLNALGKGERVTLLEHWASLHSVYGRGFHGNLAVIMAGAGAQESGGVAGVVNTGAGASLGDFEEKFLRKLHSRVRDFLGDLVDGRPVRLALPPVWQVIGGTLQASVGEHPLSGQPREGLTGTQVDPDWTLLRPLLELIQKANLERRTFPFGRCLECRRVFVQSKGRRRKFCSPNCAVQSAEAGRRDEKREYMRRYMANRRRGAKMRQAKVRSDAGSSGRPRATKGKGE